MMSLFQLKNHFFLADITTRQKTSKQFLNICTRQQRIGIFMIHSFRKHKHHGHHHKCHMVVPSTPLSHLIVGHAAFTFCIFKCTFHPITLALHPAQPLKRYALRCIAQGNLCIRIATQSLRHNQGPALNLPRFTIPYINPPSIDLNSKHTPGGMTKRHRFPAFLRERIYQLTHFKAFLIRLILCKLTSTVATFFRQIRLWIFQIDTKIRVQINNESLSHFTQSKAKSRAFAISHIRTYPSEAKALFSGMFHDLQSKVWLCSKTPLPFRHTCSFTTFRIISPFLRQVETHINRYSKLTMSQSTKNCHLTIIHFAQTAQPLTGNTNRTFSLFSKSAFIKQKACVSVLTQKLICVAGHMVNHLTVIPLRMGQKLLEIARFGIRHNFSHSVHIFTGTCLHQTAGVLAGLIRDIVSVRVKMFGVGIHERQEAPADTNKHGLGGFIIFPFVSRMFSLGLA